MSWCPTHSKEGDGTSTSRCPHLCPDWCAFCPMCGTMQPWKHDECAPKRKWIRLQAAEREASAAMQDYEAKIEHRFRMAKR